MSVTPAGILLSWQVNSMQHHADALASVLPLGGDGQTPLLCLYERDNRQQWDNPHDVRTQGKSETLVQKEGLVKGARALAVKGRRSAFCSLLGKFARHPGQMKFWEQQGSGERLLSPSSFRFLLCK